MESPVVRKPNILLTNRFVPAKLVNAMADLVICHGGQGTVQTALASGTPMVGVAMQPEQQINLDHAVLAGACIRIPITRWHAKRISAAVLQIAGASSYRSGAQRLAAWMAESSGQETAARAIWNFSRKLPESGT
jgi:UDP:flavonoid glycosyltransferase YjiC (YdhE family)